MPINSTVTFEVTERTEATTRAVGTQGFKVTTIRGVRVPRDFRDRKERGDTRIWNDFLTLDLAGEPVEFIQKALGEVGTLFSMSGRLVIDTVNDRQYPTLKGAIRDLFLIPNPDRRPLRAASSSGGESASPSDEVIDLPF